MRRGTAFLLILALIASTAGAATGTILSSRITGSIPITVSQAISVEKPSISGLPGGRPVFISVSDDGTSFSAACEVYQGEDFEIKVPLINKGEGDIFCELILDVAQDDAPITLSCSGSGKINDVVRVGEDKWKFTLDGGCSGGSDAIKIKVALSDDAEPGFYEIKGEINPVEY